MAREWTLPEIDLLGEAVRTKGCLWRIITAEYFPTRSEDAVRNMYRRWFEGPPPIRGQRRPAAAASRKVFTPEENEHLTRLVLDHDMQWTTIEREMNRPGSGRQSLRNRWSRHVLYGDRAEMRTILKTSREIEIVLRALK